MRIVCIRHGKPDFRYPPPMRRLRAGCYNDLLAAYDRAGLDPDWNIPRAYRVQGRFISSDLPRARETAELLTGVSADALEQDPLLREVPLPRFTQVERRLPAFLYMPLSRLGWFTGWMPCLENRRASKLRVRLAADRLEEMARGAEPLYVFSHGFFLWLLGRELRRRGWSTNKRGPYRYLEQGDFSRN